MCDRGRLSLFFALFGMAIAQQPPLTLELKATRTSFLAGEAPVFPLYWRVAASALDLETIELNHHRTRVLLTSEGATSPQVLTGADYLRLHQISPLSNVGSRFRAEAGRNATSNMELSNFSRAFAPGKYKLQVEYRYGDDSKATVSSNIIAFEVQPVSLKAASWQWANQHRELEGLFVIDRPKPAWLHRRLRGVDPSVMVSSVLLEDVPAHASPVFLAGTVFVRPGSAGRAAVWLDASRLCWRAFSQQGWQGPATCQATGFSAKARIVGPPSLLLKGGAPSVTVVLADGSGVAVIGATPFRGAVPPGFTLAGVSWKADGSPQLFALKSDPPAKLLGWEPGSPPREIWAAPAGRKVDRLIVNSEAPTVSVQIVSGSDWWTSGPLAPTIGPFQGPTSIHTEKGVAAAGARPDGTLVLLPPEPLQCVLPPYLALGGSRDWILCAAASGEWKISELSAR